MLPNGLKFQTQNSCQRDFVFGHHVIKVVVWLFMRCIACFVSDNKFNEEHTDTHFIYRFCDGNVQAVAEGYRCLCPNHQHSSRMVFGKLHDCKK